MSAVSRATARWRSVLTLLHTNALAPPGHPKLRDARCRALRTQLAYLLGYFSCEKPLPYLRLLFVGTELEPHPDGTDPPSRRWAAHSCVQKRLVAPKAKACCCCLRLLLRRKLRSRLVHSPALPPRASCILHVIGRVVPSVIRQCQRIDLHEWLHYRRPWRCARRPWRCEGRLGSLRCCP